MVIEPCFPVQPTVRPRKKISLFGYEGKDESVTDPQQKFKVNFFNQILDSTIQSVNKRFTQLEEHSSVFSILYNIPIKGMDTAVLTRDCATLERALTYRDSRDIDAKDLCNELKVLSRRLDSEAKPLDSLGYISGHIRTNAFVTLIVLLTLPVIVASGECTFYKLKLIKNYLCPTMSQERLNGLATISIEHELAYSTSKKQCMLLLPIMSGESTCLNKR
ncbi:zinc finger MYM-type protein 1-like [Salvelinus alpinus]